jgi:hypothetical protein
MRSILLATAFVALAPVAFAQTNPNMAPMGGMSGPGAAGGMSTPGTMGGMNPPPRTATASAGQHVVGPPNPENCGTPDEPRPCPPLPRNPLPYFPPNR